MSYTVKTREDGYSYTYTETKTYEVPLGKVLIELEHWRRHLLVDAAYKKLTKIKNKYGEDSPEYEEQHTIAFAAIEFEHDHEEYRKQGNQSHIYDIAMDILEGKLPDPREEKNG